MKNQYFTFATAWNSRSIQLGFDYPVGYMQLATLEERESYLKAILYRDFHYRRGSKFTTCLTCGSEDIFSQEFKDLYEREGWTGLAFSEPIVIHDLKPGLVQPMSYYHVKVVERCERFIGHRWVYPNGCKCLTDWEVVNDGGFSFFQAASLGFWLCQPYVAQAVKRHKLTNIACNDVALWEKVPYPHHPPDQMEF